MHYIKPGGLKNTTSWVNLLRESLNIWINYLIYQLTLVWSNYSLPGPKGYWFNYKFLTFLSSNFKEWQAQLDLNTEISLMSYSNIWNECLISWYLKWVHLEDERLLCWCQCQVK